MTAFTDYLDLRTEVIETVKRPDLADKFDRITSLAEAWLNRKLRMADQITTAVVTFISGTGSLPSDFREAIGLYDGNGYEYVQRPVTETEPTGVQTFYSIRGSTIVSPALDGSFTLHYYADVPTLTTSLTTSNWLLQKYPGLYLYAVATEAAKSAQDVDLGAILTGLRDRELADAMADDEAYRYSRARVRVGGATP